MEFPARMGILAMIPSRNPASQPERPTAAVLHEHPALCNSEDEASKIFSLYDVMRYDIKLYVMFFM